MSKIKKKAQVIANEDISEASPARATAVILKSD